LTRSKKRDRIASRRVGVKAFVVKRRRRAGRVTPWPRGTIRSLNHASSAGEGKEIVECGYVSEGRRLAFK